MTEWVILVDDDDRDAGQAPKLEAHQRGLLHRAVSVVLLDRDGRLLLQQRAAGKYHSPGAWSNTCCGHPRPGEAPAAAAARRLREEMGITAELTPAGTFRYRAAVGALIEHEIDHVFVGRFDGAPAPAPAEVAAWRWQAPADLRAELRRAPHRFTPWLPLLLDRLDRTEPAG